jgi:hypothetical protein
MLIPVLMSAMQLTMQLIAGKPLGGENEVWLRLMVAFDVIFTALSLVLLETVLVG